MRVRIELLRGAGGNVLSLVEGKNQGHRIAGPKGNGAFDVIQEFVCDIPNDVLARGAAYQAGLDAEAEAARAVRRSARGEKGGA